MRRDRLETALGVGVAAMFVGLFVAERLRPLRSPTQPGVRRPLTSAVVGLAQVAIAQAGAKLLVEPYAAHVVAQRKGLAGSALVPRALAPVVAFLVMDWAMYVWHRMSHRNPELWRLHRVHHVDRDLDTTTALRFHAVDQAASQVVRLAQVRLAGASPTVDLVWRSWFAAAVAFHHSNLRLPIAVEERLARWVVTPRLHGIHHSERRAQTDANWSSGLSIWDRLHGSWRPVSDHAAVPAIGVPGWRDAGDMGVAETLALPWAPERDDWLEKA